jgi:hypothetical protein
VPKNARPTPADRVEAIRVSLGGLARGEELGAIVRRLEPLHPRNDTFPGEVLLDLAADALEESGATRADPIAFEGIRERYLPEREFRSRAQHHKSLFALRAAAMIRAGVDPGLLEEVSWWQTDDLWVYAFDALIVYVRAAAECAGERVDVICRRLADRRAIALPDGS